MWLYLLLLRISYFYLFKLSYYDFHLIIKPIHIHPMKWISHNSKYLLFVFLLSIRNWDFAWYPWKLYQSAMHVTTLYSNSINLILFHFTLYLWKLHGWQRYGILSRGAAMPGCPPSTRGPYSALCLFLSKYFSVIFISQQQINIYAKQSKSTWLLLLHLCFH